MKIKQIYMVKFSYRGKNGTTDYEFQSSSESYIRLDGEKNHKLRFIGLENTIYEQLIKEITALNIEDWEYEISVDELSDPSWSILLCGSNNYMFVESNHFNNDYDRLFKIIKKYDLD